MKATVSLKPWRNDIECIQLYIGVFLQFKCVYYLFIHVQICSLGAFLKP